MTVSTFIQPNHTTDTAPQYKANIDASIDVLAKIGYDFAPRENSIPAMSMIVQAGQLWDGSTFINKITQGVGIVAPSTNPRIDRVSIRLSDGGIVKTTGAEAASPVPPSYPANHYPICQIALETTTTTVTNSLMTDERPLIAFRPEPVTPDIIGTALVYINATENSPNSTGVVIPWDVEVRDDNDYWTSGTPTRFTIPTGKTLARFKVHVRISASAGGAANTHELYIRKNGVSTSPIDLRFWEYDGGNETMSFNIESPWMTCVATDYFDIYHTHLSTVARSIVAAWFEIEAK